MNAIDIATEAFLQCVRQADVEGVRAGYNGDPRNDKERCSDAMSVVFEALRDAGYSLVKLEQVIGSCIRADRAFVFKLVDDMRGYDATAGFPKGPLDGE